MNKAPTFLQIERFPLQCTHVLLEMRTDPTSGYPRYHIIDQCENLPNQRVKGIYVCDEHAEAASQPNVNRCRVSGEEVSFS